MDVFLPFKGSGIHILRRYFYHLKKSKHFKITFYSNFVCRSKMHQDIHDCRSFMQLSKKHDRLNDLSNPYPHNVPSSFASIPLIFHHIENY